MYVNCEVYQKKEKHIWTKSTQILNSYNIDQKSIGRE